MKKFYVMMVMVFVCGSVFTVSCGDSSSDSSSGSAAQDAETSLDGMSALFNDDDIAPCLNGEATTCDCPNGGSMSIDPTASEIAFDNCTSSDDLVYDGTLTSNDGETVSGTLTTFGECTDLIVTSVPLDDACTGSVQGTCAGETYTCNLTGSDEYCDCQ